MIAIFIAILSGVFVILSMIINANLAKYVGVFQGTLINYLAGLLGMTTLMLLYGNMADLNPQTISSIPIWALGGGLCGVVIVASMNVVIPKIPAVYSTLLLFIGQISVGLFVDYLRFDLIETFKIAGVGLVLVGITYNNYVDQKQLKSEIETNNVPIEDSCSHKASSDKNDPDRLQHNKKEEQPA